MTSVPGGKLRDRMAVAATSETLAVRLLHPLARPLARTRPGDAGHDLRCVEPFALEPGERRTVPTGVAVALPEGTAGLVVPRSGLAARDGISVVNGPGLIDANYRGEVKVVLVNLGAERFTAQAGDRIAQLVVVPVVTPQVAVVEDLPDGGDDRGEGGFGSSGRT